MEGAEPSFSSTVSAPGWGMPEPTAAWKHRFSEQPVSWVMLVYSQPLPDCLPIVMLHPAVLDAGTVVFEDMH